jgi:uncharacterized protein YndB with AHSA1/START domain
LSDVPEGTHVRLTHEGLHTFPKVPAFATRNFEAGWTDLIGSRLADYVENADREIVIEREFNAPRRLVWDAMTKAEHVAKWWGPRGFTTTVETMDFRVGGDWKLTMVGPDGMKYPNKSIFREIVDQERVVFSHGGGREDGGKPGANFVATWSFDDLAPERTRVTLRMVFQTPEGRDLVVREYNAVEGGKQTLTRLGEHLAAALSEPFVIEREFNAPRDLVWKAWTERDRFMQWFGPKGCSMPDATMDFRVGGELHFRLRAQDGGEMWGKWIFREIVEPEKILFANSFSDETGAIAPCPFPGEWPLQMLTEIRFTENNGKTLVTLQSLPLDATAAERKTFDDHRGSFTQGWTGTFEQFEEYLGTQA